VSKDQKPADYSFVLRLWQVRAGENQEQNSGQWEWRASLDNPQTGDRVGFANMELLFEYIHKKTKRNECRGNKNMDE
jgi:hypothetical protein